MNELNLLQDSLEEYIDKWKNDMEEFNNRGKVIYPNLDSLIIQRNSMIFLAQWIINSINRGLYKIHATNICNIILKEEK